MTGGRLFKTLRALSYVSVFVAGSLILVSYKIYQEIAMEIECRHQFGLTWKQHYESHFGPDSLSQAHEKVAFGVGGIVVILTILWLIYRNIAGENQSSRGSSRRRRRSSRLKS
jgi:hypothetical protein